MNIAQKFTRQAAIGAVSAFVMSLGLGSAAEAQEVTLKAVSGLPKTHFFIKKFADLVKQVNAEGKGVLQINWVGGPEVTPGRKQAQALRRGVFDIVYGPAAYYGGQVPEHFAMLGSKISPMEARKSDAFSLLDKAWEKRLGAKLLAWPNASVQYQLFLKVEPKRTADGGLDVGGKKIRAGAPIYGPLIRAIGGSMLMLPPPKIQTALERGMIEGLGFVTVSYATRGWSKYVKYIVDPPVGRSVIAMMINRKKFDSMPKKAQDLLTKIAIAHERESYQSSIDEAKAERKLALSKGIKVVALKGEARKKYIDGMTNWFWEQLAKKDAEAAKILKAKFAP